MHIARTSALVATLVAVACSNAGTSSTAATSQDAGGPEGGPIDSATTDAMPGDVATVGDGAPPCSTMLIVGVRGSGEDQAADLGMGTTVFPLYELFQTSAAGYGLYYDATVDTQANVTSAAQALVAFVRSRGAQCPSEKVVLAGFSLGAWVVGDALEGGLPPSSVTAAVMFADPMFNPRDSAIAGGTFNAAFGGEFGQRPPYPQPFDSLVRSYCRNEDVICQLNEPGASKAEHARYCPDQICAAAAFLAPLAGVQPPSTCSPTCAGMPDAGTDG